MTTRRLPALNAARTNYVQWHAKQPDRDVTQRYAFPRTVHALGRAKSCVYVSDKWEADGDFHDYVHDFDSEPVVYTVDGAGAARDVAKLLCVADVNGPVIVTHLAQVIEFKYSDGHRDIPITFGGALPVLAGTTDNRTLVIFDGPWPWFIHGGTMRITERGIVD